MYRLYSLVLAIGFVLALPWYVLRGRLTASYLRSLRQRFGQLPAGLDPAGHPALWIHAVSVGEVLAAQTLCAPLRRLFPDHRVLVSTTTLTGRAVAEQTLSDVDGLFFAPFDFRGSVCRALERLRPALLLLVETELWPNLIHEAHRRGARVAVVNGRISPRSFARYRRIRSFLRPVLSRVDLFLMQEPAHVERIVAIGAPPERVLALGSLKYDAVRAPQPNEELRRLLDGYGEPSRPLWVAGSTVSGEEPDVLRALGEVRQRVPTTRLVLAPRHPERFDEVAALVAAHGFSCLRRTRSDGPWRDGDVLLLDTLGELSQAYAFATVAFVGGSLVARGGHNVLEAAALAKPVVVGPHMENFQQIADELRAAGGLIQIRSAAQLAAEITSLLTEPARRAAVGHAALELVERNRGAVDRIVHALGRLFQ